MRCEGAKRKWPGTNMIFVIPSEMGRSFAKTWPLPGSRFQCISRLEPLPGGSPKVQDSDEISPNEVWLSFGPVGAAGRRQGNFGGGVCQGRVLADRTAGDLAAPRLRSETWGTRFECWRYTWLFPKTLSVRLDAISYARFCLKIFCFFFSAFFLFPG